LGDKKLLCGFRPSDNAMRTRFEIIAASSAKTTMRRAWSDSRFSSRNASQPTASRTTIMPILTTTMRATRFSLTGGTNWNSTNTISAGNPATAQFQRRAEKLRMPVHSSIHASSSRELPTGIDSQVGTISRRPISSQPTAPTQFDTLQTASA
jgi:hypothetical protein